MGGINAVLGVSEEEVRNWFLTNDGNKKYNMWVKQSIVDLHMSNEYRSRRGYRNERQVSEQEEDVLFD